MSEKLSNLNMLLYLDLPNKRLIFCENLIFLVGQQCMLPTFRLLKNFPAIDVIDQNFAHLDFTIPDS